MVWELEEEEESQGTTTNTTMIGRRNIVGRGRRTRSARGRGRRTVIGRGRRTRRICVPYGRNYSFIYIIRVKDIFVISSYVLGAPTKMLGAPSNTPLYFFYLSIIKLHSFIFSLFFSFVLYWLVR